MLGSLGSPAGLPSRAWLWEPERLGLGRAGSLHPCLCAVLSAGCSEVTESHPEPPACSWRGSPAKRGLTAWPLPFRCG